MRTDGGPLVMPGDFTSTIRWVSGGRSPQLPYPAGTPVAERRERGWRASVGPLTGWVWQAAGSRRAVPTDLLTVLTVVANTYDDGAVDEILAAHLAAAAATPDLGVARLLARDLLFSLEPIDLQSIAEEFLGVSVATARRRVTHGTVPPPLFSLPGDNVWTRRQRAAEPTRAPRATEVTGREELAPDGTWRHLGSSAAAPVPLCNLIARHSLHQDEAAYDVVCASLADTVASSSDPDVLRHITSDLATMLPLVAGSTPLEPPSAEPLDGPTEIPPPLIVKAGPWIWYRAQFGSGAGWRPE